MLPRVTAKTLTALVMDARKGVRSAMQDGFDRPTPFTLSRVGFKPATPQVLRAMVGVPDSNAASGKATSEYLRPGAYGSRARYQKKSEYLLARMGYLPAGWVMLPGSFLRGKTDGYGNVPGSYYKQIIRDLQIKNTKGPPKPRFAAAQRRAARMGVNSEFFAVGQGRNTLNKGGGWLPPGVYRRTGQGGRVLQQYFRFMPRAAYDQQIDIERGVRDIVKQNARTRWRESFIEVEAVFARNRGRGGR
jgi:hypothetical protein